MWETYELPIIYSANTAPLSRDFAQPVPDDGDKKWHRPPAQCGQTGMLTEQHQRELGNVLVFGTTLPLAGNPPLFCSGLWRRISATTSCLTSIIKFQVRIKQNQQDGVIPSYWFECLGRFSPTVYFAIALALAFASSIPPTYRNACSGRSSTLPSMMSEKLLSVSSSLTYFPSMPVNCWAT
jgi:hypothetical protein